MIPFSNLKLQQQTIKEQLCQTFDNVLESGWYILGERLQTFEKNFAVYNGSTYCAGVASGTDAITVALMALGVGAGDEVITTDITAFPTITAIINCGASPVVVDIDKSSGLMNCTLIEEKISEKTRAVVAVHLYGQCCDMDLLLSICKKHSLFLVEDAAQAAGASYKNKKAGTFGDCGAFSFYPTKNLGAIGDGGAIVTNNEKLYNNIIQIRNYGQKNRYIHESRGINSRLDELQAAILDVKLLYLDLWNGRRRKIAEYYSGNLKNVVCLSHSEHVNSNYHLFVVKHPNRNAFLEHISKKGVQALIHYPVPVHMQKAFSYQIIGSFPESVEFADTIFSLPMYPELTDEQVEKIVNIVNSFERS